MAVYEAAKQLLGKTMHSTAVAHAMIFMLLAHYQMQACQVTVIGLCKSY